MQQLNIEVLHFNFYIENDIFGSNLSICNVLYLFTLIDMGFINFFCIYNILYWFVVRRQI